MLVGGQWTVGGQCAALLLVRMLRVCWWRRWFIVLNVVLDRVNRIARESIIVWGRGGRAVLQSALDVFLSEGLEGEPLRMRFKKASTGSEVLPYSVTYCTSVHYRTGAAPGPSNGLNRLFFCFVLTHFRVFLQRKSVVFIFTNQEKVLLEWRSRQLLFISQTWRADARDASSHLKNAREMY